MSDRDVIYLPIVWNKIIKFLSIVHPLNSKLDLNTEVDSQMCQNLISLPLSGCCQGDQFSSTNLHKFLIFFVHIFYTKCSLVVVFFFSKFRCLQVSVPLIYLWGLNSLLKSSAPEHVARSRYTCTYTCIIVLLSPSYLCIIYWVRNYKEPPPADEVFSSRQE